MNMDKIKVIKNRMQAGGLAVINHLKDVNISDLKYEVHLPLNDDDSKFLAEYLEKQLIMAKSKPQRFIKQRYDLIKNVVFWVKKYNKYKTFVDFTIYTHRNIQQSYDILCAYQTSLIDTWTVLAPYGYLWYGLDENNNPLFIKELFEDYDIEGYKLLEEIGKKPRQEIINAVNKYEKETDQVRVNERNIINVIYNMVGLINNKNEKYIFPYQNWFNHYHVNTNFPRVYKENDYYLELLDKRSNFLYSDGINIKCFNAGVFNEIYLKEEFLEDGMLLLYRVKDSIENKFTMGFIDFRDKYTFLAWKHAHGVFCDDNGKLNFKDGEYFSNKFLNFILEVYCYLTCDSFEQDVSRSIALKQLVNTEYNFILNEGQPGIYYDIKEEVENSSENVKGTGITSSFHKVKPHLRKGNASEMALANARLFGVIIKPGYTFVKPHTRGKKEGE